MEGRYRSIIEGTTPVFGGAEENYKIHRPGYSTSGPTFEPEVFQYDADVLSRPFSVLVMLNNSFGRVNDMKKSKE